MPHEVTKLSVWDDEYALKLLIYCIDNAAHKPHMFDGKRIDVGQFPTSYRKMAADLHWKNITLQKHLRSLEYKYHEIEVKSGRHGTLIIVVHYKDFQKGIGSVLANSTPDENERATACTSGVLADSTQVCYDIAPQNNSTEQENRTLTLASLEDEFSAFWSAYPKSEDRPAAERAYLRQRRAGATHEAIMAALNADIPSKQWIKEDGQYIPYAGRWLQRQKWREYMKSKSTEEKPT